MSAVRCPPVYCILFHFAPFPFDELAIAPSFHAVRTSPRAILTVTAWTTHRSACCAFSGFFFFSISVVPHLRVLSYASVRILGRFVFCLSCRVSLRGSTVPGLLHCSVRIPPGADAVRSHLKSAQGRRALFARLDFLPCCLLSSPNTSFVLCYAFHAERTAAVF